MEKVETKGIMYLLSLTSSKCFETLRWKDLEYPLGLRAQKRTRTASKKSTWTAMWDNRRRWNLNIPIKCVFGMKTTFKQKGVFVCFFEKYFCFQLRCEGNVGPLFAVVSRKSIWKGKFQTLI